MTAPTVSDVRMLDIQVNLFARHGEQRLDIRNFPFGVHRKIETPRNLNCYCVSVASLGGNVELRISG